MDNYYANIQFCSQLDGKRKSNTLYRSTRTGTDEDVTTTYIRS